MALTAVLMLELVAPNDRSRLAKLRRVNFEFRSCVGLRRRPGPPSNFAASKAVSRKWARSVGFDVKSVLGRTRSEDCRREEIPPEDSLLYLESKELADFYYDHARGREYRPRRNTKDKKL